MLGRQADESAWEIQAKEAAKLLPLPDSLVSLKRIREDYASRFQVHKTLNVTFHVFYLQLTNCVCLFLSEKRRPARCKCHESGA